MATLATLATSGHMDNSVRPIRCRSMQEYAEFCRCSCTAASNVAVEYSSKVELGMKRTKIEESSALLRLAASREFPKSDIVFTARAQSRF